MFGDEAIERYKPLYVFCKVVEHLSFSHAAKEMGVSQPTVSVNIAAIEKELGCMLFERRRPLLVLTPDGEHLYAIAKPLVDAIGYLPVTFLDAKGEINHGQVSIVAGEAVLLNILPEIATIFQQQYPNIALQFAATVARDIPEILLNDEADFALGSLLEEHKLLRQTPIYRFSPVLILPKNHPLNDKKHITLRDVAEARIIAPPKHSYTWQMMRLVFAQHQLNYQVVIEASSSEVTKRFVAAGLGVAILSEACVVTDALVNVRPFEQYFPERAYGLIERRGKFLTPQATKFRETVLQWASSRSKK